jgi:hypothetical protein
MIQTTNGTAYLRSFVMPGRPEADANTRNGSGDDGGGSRDDGGDGNSGDGSNVPKQVSARTRRPAGPVRRHRRLKTAA